MLCWDKTKSLKYVPSTCNFLHQCILIFWNISGLWFTEKTYQVNIKILKIKSIFKEVSAGFISYNDIIYSIKTYSR